MRWRGLQTRKAILLSRQNFCAELVRRTRAVVSRPAQTRAGEPHMPPAPELPALPPLKWAGPARLCFWLAAAGRKEGLAQFPVGCGGC
mmetsp:Transcript_2936/g.8727  ORF Transcript_2936/g.8727 Transcript_2936/m.8727 type:complete len:88 (-) Transcript_2936:167-430(-)